MNSFTSRRRPDLQGGLRALLRDPLFHHLPRRGGPGRVGDRCAVLDAGVGAGRHRRHARRRTVGHRRLRRRAGDERPGRDDRPRQQRRQPDRHRQRHGAAPGGADSERAGDRAEGAADDAGRRPEYSRWAASPPARSRPPWPLRRWRSATRWARPTPRPAAQPRRRWWRRTQRQREPDAWPSSARPRTWPAGTSTGWPPTPMATRRLVARHRQHGRAAGPDAARGAGDADHPPKPFRTAVRGHPWQRMIPSPSSGRRGRRSAAPAPS